MQEESNCKGAQSQDEWVREWFENLPEVHDEELFQIDFLCDEEVIGATLLVMEHTESEAIASFDAMYLAGHTAEGLPAGETVTGMRLLGPEESGMRRVIAEYQMHKQ